MTAEADKSLTSTARTAIHRKMRRSRCLGADVCWATQKPWDTERSLSKRTLLGPSLSTPPRSYYNVVSTGRAPFLEQGPLSKFF